VSVSAAGRIFSQVPWNLKAVHDMSRRPAVASTDLPQSRVGISS
jgi:hypothetical protein